MVKTHLHMLFKRAVDVGEKGSGFYHEYAAYSNVLKHTYLFLGKRVTLVELQQF